jgi:hypothetical protein
MANVPKVDRSEFENVVKGLLRQKPMKRSEIRAGKKKTGKVIPERPKTRP